jgi:stage IV sporulation protein FB
MEELDYYPQKPELVEKKSTKGAGKTIFSILLFVLAFTLVGSNDFMFIFFLVLVLFIHEMGHFSLMKLFKYSNVKMLFVPLMGAFVQGKKEEYKQKQSLLVVIAGPVPGVIIGMILLYFGVKLKIEWMSDLSFLFLFLNMLNLLPLDPLDGGQILKLLITKNQELFQLVFSFVSSLILIGFGWYFELWIIVVFGFLMGLRVRSIQKNYQIHKELDEDKTNYKTSYSNLSNKDFSRIKEAVINHTPALRTYITQVSDDSVDQIVADQVNNVLVSPLTRNASFIFKLSVVFIWFGSFICPFLLAYYLHLLG